MNENKKIAFLTAAYNGEKTLQRTIDSIKAQTHTNFEYYILNDGSSDSTQAIINENIRRDKRIHSITFDKNDCQAHFIAAIKKILKRYDFDYFAICDHDDEYLPEFAEKTIAAAERTGADTVICEILYNTVGVGEQPFHYLSEEKLLSSQSDFAQFYPGVLCAQMRTQWGKLFSIKALRETDLNVISIVKYGRDTIFCNEVVKHCDSVLILCEPLYRFYIAGSSETTRVEEERIYAAAKLYSCAESFINTKCGEFGYMDRDFTYVNYLADINTITLQTAQDNNLSQQTKIDYLIKIFKDPIFDKVAAVPNVYELEGRLGGNKFTFEIAMEKAAQTCLQLFPHANEEQMPEFAALATYTAVLAGYNNPMIPIMGKGPKAVILTLCHNSGEKLKKTVQSVLSQTYWNFDYFLADNNSSDETRATILELEKTDPRIHHIFYDENKFPDVYVDLIPKVLENSEYKYFAVCDHDDLLFPKFLETALKTAESDDADLIFGGEQYFNPQKNKLDIMLTPSKLILDSPESFEDNLYYFYLYSAWFGVLFSTDLVKKADFTSHKTLVRSHDIIFTLDAIEKSKKAVLLPEMFYRHFTNDGSASTLPDIRNANSTEAQLKKCIEVYKKRGGEDEGKFNIFFHSCALNLLRDFLNSVSDLSVYDINSDLVALLLGYLDTTVFFECLIKYTDEYLTEYFIQVTTNILKNREAYISVADENQKERLNHLFSVIQKQLNTLCSFPQKSVILTLCHNSTGTLRRTVQSVLAQTDGNFDYFLADNASTDGTRELILELEKTDPRIHHIFYDENKFPDVYVDLIPKVIENPEYKYFAICDSDDELTPRFLETSLKTITETDAGLVISEILSVDSNNTSTKRVFSEKKVLLKKGEATDYNLIRVTDFLRWNSILFKTNTIKKTDFSIHRKINTHHDCIFTLDNMCNSDSIILISEIGYICHIRDNSASRTFDMKDSAAAELLIEKMSEFFTLYSKDKPLNDNLKSFLICRKLFEKEMFLSNSATKFSTPEIAKLTVELFDNDLLYKNKTLLFSDNEHTIRYFTVVRKELLRIKDTLFSAADEATKAGLERIYDFLEGK
jgi:glycosyltransferase involved in cell wall biosynthesis